MIRSRGSPIVRQTCSEFGYPYKEYTTLREYLRDHYVYLWELGRGERGTQAAWQRSSSFSSMASPTNTSACTFMRSVSWRACERIFPIWVWPPRQSMRDISSPSFSACDTQREARHSASAR